jgi:Flp pilus assembly CpaF family ATPase
VVEAPALEVIDRVADRLVSAIENDHPSPDRPSLIDDRRRQQLLVGHWVGEELRGIDRVRAEAGQPPLGHRERVDLMDLVVAEVLGAGPLERFLNDPAVEEIDVNSAEHTWVTTADGGKVDAGRLWADDRELTAFQKRFARRMSATGEGRLDTSAPMATLQTTSGARVVMVLGGEGEHGISPHPRMAIRRFTVQRAGLAGLATRGLFDVSMVPQLEALVRAGFTMLISGPPGAGKTTLLVEMLGAVDPRERIVTVERHLLELRLEDDPRHPDAPALHTRGANSEGEGAISTRSLVELTRRLNPDRVVVGELVEDEALDMLDVASMCARGSLATIHAHTADVVLHRLAYYVAKSNTSLPEFAVWNLIAQTVDFVVHIDLVRNVGSTATTRRVVSLIEVGGAGEIGGVSTTEVFAADDDQRLRQVAPISQRRLKRLRRAGEDPALFLTWEAP